MDDTVSHSVSVANSAGSSSSDDEQLKQCDTTPPKKRKRLCRFNPAWLKEFSWCREVPSNRFEVECKLCRRIFSVGHGGKNDISSHNKSDFHKRNVASAKCSSIRSFYVASTPTGLDKQVSMSNCYFVACL
jgi:hypothetical protein